MRNIIAPTIMLVKSILTTILQLSFSPCGAEESRAFYTKRCKFAYNGLQRFKLFNHVLQDLFVREFIFPKALNCHLGCKSSINTKHVKSRLIASNLTG